MLWFGKELVPVFALVLVTVRATGWCNLTMMDTYDVAAVRGTAYTVMKSYDSDPDLEYEGFVNSVERDGGRRYLKIQEYDRYRGSRVCEQYGVMRCEIRDGHCHGQHYSSYIVAAYSNYVASYSQRRIYSTSSINEAIWIYTKAVNQERVTIENLPPEFKTRIRDVCGPAAITSNFYPKKFLVKDFIPGCSTE